MSERIDTIGTPHEALGLKLENQSKEALELQEKMIVIASELQ